MVTHYFQVAIFFSLQCSIINGIPFMIVFESDLNNLQVPNTLKF